MMPREFGVTDCSKNLAGDPEAVVRIERDANDATAGKFDHRGIRDPGWFEEEDIDPLLSGGHHRGEQGLLAAGRDDDLVRL